MRAGAIGGLLALALLGSVLAGLASGERAQHGNLIVSLDGSFSPLTLPRDRPAPVSVNLDAGLRTADGTPLPRVTKVELGIPGQGLIKTQGLPTCAPRTIRNATSAKALSVCRPALVGRGRMLAQILLPHQEAFEVHATLLAFNGRVRGRRAVILHAESTDPPTSVVLPFLIRLRTGKFGTALVARLPATLGPWPRIAHIEMHLARHYRYRGHRLSYLGASCPIPKRFSAGFFSFAKATFTLANGGQIGTGIARSCRAR
jgi:hypothetical protein